VQAASQTCLGPSRASAPLLCPTAILSELLQRENRVLHFWTLKKRRLDQCQQYVVFERSAKQALDWIQETGEYYLSTHTSTGETTEETQELLKEYGEFRVPAKVGSTREPTPHPPSTPQSGQVHVMEGRAASPHRNADHRTGGDARVG